MPWKGTLNNGQVWMVTVENTTTTNNGKCAANFLWMRRDRVAEIDSVTLMVGERCDPNNPRSLPTSVRTGMSQLILQLSPPDGGSMSVVIVHDAKTYETVNLTSDLQWVFEVI